MLPNWADEHHFGPRPRDPVLARTLGLEAPTVLMYAGNFGELQDLDTVVEAARLVTNRPDILVALVGAGVTEPRLRSAVERHDLRNVRFVPPQPFEGIAGVLALADAQIVSLKDVPVLRSTLPSKLQANLASGQPIIGAVAGDSAAVIEDAKAGVTSPPGDALALARAMEWFADLGQNERDRLGFNARSAYDQRFSEKVIGDDLSALLHEAAESSWLTYTSSWSAVAGSSAARICEALERRGARAVAVHAPRLTIPAGGGRDLVVRAAADRLRPRFAGAAAVVNAAGISRRVQQRRGRVSMPPTPWCRWSSPWRVPLSKRVSCRSAAQLSKDGDLASTTATRRLR